MLCARREEWLTPAVDELRAPRLPRRGRVVRRREGRQVQAVVDQAMAAFGQVDILVNNAGLSWGERPETMPLDKWHKVLDANLTGAFLFSQAAGREMLKRQYGRIINIASVAGLHGLGERPALRGLRRQQGGPDGADARAGRDVGTPGHPRERDRARVSSTSRLADPAIQLGGARHQAVQPDPARRAARRRAEGRRGLPAADASNYVTGQVIVDRRKNHRMIGRTRGGDPWTRSTRPPCRISCGTKSATASRS